MHGAVPPFFHVLCGVELTAQVSECGHVDHMLHVVDLCLRMQSFDVASAHAAEDSRYVECNTVPLGKWF